MAKTIWLTRLAGIALAICAPATKAFADEGEPDPDDAGEERCDDGTLAVPELDPRSGGLALTLLGGSLFVLHGRRKRVRANA